MKQVFVTGASGFPGAYLVRALVERGYGVLTLAGATKAIDAVRALGAEPVEADLAERPPLQASLQLQVAVEQFADAVCGFHGLDHRDYPDGGSAGSGREPPQRSAPRPRPRVDGQICA